MAKQKFFIASGLIFILLLTTGASCGASLKPAPADGGIFRSTDKGMSWAQKVLIPTVTGAPKSFTGANIVTMAVDPEDNKTVYIGTEGSGMLVTYNSGESWLSPERINRGTINAIAVDPKSKCTIYASAENKIYKSTDCSRFWENVYFDSRTDKLITTIALDAYNPAIIYAGISSGDLIKSDNAGLTWNTIKRFDDRIDKVLIDKFDSKNVYVAIKGRGIFKTTDRGSTWVDLNKDLKQYSGSFEFKNLIQDQTGRDSLFLVSKYGWLKTSDAGNTWQGIALLTPPGSAVIYSSAVNPQNNKEIFYCTATTFYYTADGGITWKTQKLPTTRLASYLLIDPVNPSVIYMGTKYVKK
jgi:photosystem II stability/assembly factor-like uncharacterized protein